jgi:acyl carrier protein
MSDDLLKTFTDLLTSEFGVPAEEISAEATFEALGLDSLDIVELTLALQDRTGVNLGDDDLDRRIARLAAGPLGRAGAITSALDGRASPDEVQEMIARVYQPELLAERQKTGDTSPLMGEFGPRAENVWQAISFAPGAELETAKGTWWGAFNAVTYMEDHMRESSTGDRSNILSSAWLGGGARRKQEALRLCTEYAKVA